MMSSLRSYDRALQVATERIKSPRFHEGSPIPLSHAMLFRPVPVWEGEAFVAVTYGAGVLYLVPNRDPAGGDGNARVTFGVVSVSAVAAIPVVSRFVRDVGLDSVVDEPRVFVDRMNLPECAMPPVGVVDGSALPLPVYSSVCEVRVFVHSGRPLFAPLWVPFVRDSSVPGKPAPAVVGLIRGCTPPCAEAIESLWGRHERSMGFTKGRALEGPRWEEGVGGGDTWSM